MRGDRLSPRCRISGKVRGYHVVTGRDKTTFRGPINLPGLWHSNSGFTHNDILYDWATITGELLRGTPSGKLFKISGMYLEYENNGGAAVSPPTFERDGNKAYYDSLSLSGTRDYLRVPVVATAFSSTDEELFPGGNKLEFYAMSSGVAGVHGKPFSDAVQSRVFGGALVAFPDDGDASQDLIFSRFYFDDSAKQLVKLPGSEIGLHWPLTLE